MAAFASIYIRILGGRDGFVSRETRTNQLRKEEDLLKNSMILEAIPVAFGGAAQLTDHHEPDATRVHRNPSL